MAGICRLGDAAGSLARRIFSAPSQRRSFAAAALAEMDCWTEWEEEELGRHASMVAAETCRERHTRGLQWVFMGSPGVQRSVYATRVAKLLDVPYISMGSLVRQELHPNSSLYKMIVNAVNEGKLVPEEIIFGILSKRLEDGYQRGDSGFILDGIPRTRTQAEILDQIADIDLVVNLKCVHDCFVKKHFGADICSHCGKTSDAIKSESTCKNPCLDTCTGHVQLNSSSAVDMNNHRMEKSLVCTQQDHHKMDKRLLGNGEQDDDRVVQRFQRSFVQVQSILDQNRLLINEINQNHESKIPGNLSRNVGLIRELNNNIRRVVDLYSELSLSFTRSTEASPEGNSQRKLGHKRLRPGQ